MTAALRHPIWDATDALADMQSRRRAYLRHAEAADWNNEPGVAAMWQREADQLGDQIAAHMHGVAVFAANKLDHDRHDVPDDEQRLRIDWAAAVTYAAGGAVIYGLILWGIPLYCAALAWIGGAA